MLTRFLECPHGVESERLLERLIRDEAAPVVERVVSYKVRGGPGEDVRGDVLADLIARLRELKDSDDGESIRDFRAYSAVAAYNGCNQYYRRCFSAAVSLGEPVALLAGFAPEARAMGWS